VGLPTGKVWIRDTLKNPEIKQEGDSPYIPKVRLSRIVEQVLVFDDSEDMKKGLAPSNVANILLRKQRRDMDGNLDFSSWFYGLGNLEGPNFRFLWKTLRFMQACCAFGEDIESVSPTLVSNSDFYDWKNWRWLEFWRGLSDVGTEPRYFFCNRHPELLTHGGELTSHVGTLHRHLGELLLHRLDLEKSGLNLFPCFLDLSVNSLQRPDGNNDAANSNDDQCDVGEVLRRKQTAEIAWRLGGMAVFLPLGCFLIYHYDGLASRAGRILAFGSGVSFVSIAMGLGFLPVYHQGCADNNANTPSHGDKLYHKKSLTAFTLCNTVNIMANVLSAEKQTAIIAALAEGSSIRSIERITGVHRDTIMRLGVKVGKGCQMLMDSKMQDLDCHYLQFDELWGFIGKKERHVSVDDSPELGDVWTFCAIDSETKLVPSFKVGKRTHATTTEFVQDVASRMRNRVQVSSDAMHLYAEAMELAFGADVDYGQCVKAYVHDSAHHPERQYSAPHFASAVRRPITGNPEMELVSTSHVERLNATTRLHMRRLTRLTLAFSKKLENFEAAVGLHFAYYNFVKRHNTLRCTPAMAAGIERDFWTVGNLLEAIA